MCRKFAINRSFFIILTILEFIFLNKNVANYEIFEFIFWRRIIFDNLRIILNLFTRFLLERVCKINFYVKLIDDQSNSKCS